MSSMSEMHGYGVHLFHRRLPPLHALTVFAAAAASGSFSQAAELLSVTQGAVSRQIQQLEKHLGCALFLRHKRGLRLTPEGQSLLPVVDDALGRLAGACENLRTIGQVLVLRMPPTFASRWFLPILPELRALLPDVDVRITTYEAWEPDFERSDVAVGHLGKERLLAAIEPWHGHQVAIYRQKDKAWQRQVIDSTLTDGHTILTADFDGDGRDEILAGFRQGKRGVYIYHEDGGKWRRQVLSEGEIAAAGCAIADFNADRKPDIACIGSTTTNLILWTQN